MYPYGNPSKPPSPPASGGRSWALDEAVAGDPCRAGAARWPLSVGVGPVLGNVAVILLVIGFKAVWSPNADRRLVSDVILDVVLYGSLGSSSCWTRNPPCAQ